MEIKSVFELSLMEPEAVFKYAKQLELQLKLLGWYKKNEAGTLTESQQETFNRIMELFRWIRINCG